MYWFVCFVLFSVAADKVKQCPDSEVCTPFIASHRFWQWWIA